MPLKRCAEKNQEIVSEGTLSLALLRRRYIRGIIYPKKGFKEDFRSLKERKIILQLKLLMTIGRIGEVFQTSSLFLKETSFFALITTRTLCLLALKAFALRKTKKIKFCLRVHKRIYSIMAITQLLLLPSTQGAPLKIWNTI